MFQYVSDIFNNGIWKECCKLKDQHLINLSSDLISLQMSSKATSTICKYSSSWNVWRTWAESKADIPTIPASPLHVALFLTDLYLSCTEKGTGPSTIESVVYAIRWADSTAGLDPPTDHPIVQSTLEGAKRKLGRPVKPKEPVSLDLVTRLCNHYAGSSSL